MRKFAALVENFVRDQRGATAIEYTFIAALMSVATIAAMRQIGLSVNDLTSGVMAGLK
ncbi:Flp family type IVb pilin [Bosea sp. AAP35]|uniref:Flp family type IVb pilin n=1 Tax=Bosea sp. AAP35 TaxID=1523417 RepID=UPI0009E99DE8|nr:Flp family type IVb pilin [Bosea sp. AAP35]